MPDANSPLPADIWYLAVCAECTPYLPQPFYDETARDTWADEHEAGTGHTVVRAQQIDTAPAWVELGETESGGTVFIAPLGTRRRSTARRPPCRSR